MKTILPKDLADETEKDQGDLLNQLKECVTFSNKQIFPTVKRLITKGRSSDQAQIPTTCLKDIQITNTQQAFSSRIGQQTLYDQSANSLMASKSAASYARPSRSTLITKRDQIKPRKKKWKELRDVIQTQKVNGLKEIFCSKVKRNNPYSHPVYYQYEIETFAKGFLDTNGIELKENIQKIVSLFVIYNVISSIFIFTLSMVFTQIREEIIIKTIQIFGALLFALEIILNFITVKFSLGRKLENIKQISSDYLKHRFPIDCLNLVIILIYLITQQKSLSYIRIITLLKVHDCMDRLQKLEIYFIQNYYNEQYWSLFKVFLFNFCFAHMLAIILTAMSNVNMASNWIQSKNLTNAPWHEKYIWSYYWGTTIMLTIGFGDFTPVCYQEALCMIFIETISCMVLAYNINCVGSLIANIRSQDIEKSKNMKIFKKLSDKHGIDESLSWKINNYIEEHANIKKLFNIEEEVQFVQKLPTAFRTDYLKQANKTIFQRLFFFNHLMEKTLFSLAENIQMKITHPQQVILNTEKNFDIFILKNGEIGYTSRKINRKYNKNVFDRMKVEQNGAPFLLNTNFITKNRSPYSIKSMVYSVLYYLDYERLIEIFKETHLDYELYCRERDKNKNKIDEFEVFPCQFCQQKHTKFLCPKLHFVPIQQHIMNKYIFKEKKDKNVRISSFERLETPKESSLKRYLFNKQIYDEKKFEEATQTVTKKFKKQKYVIDQLKTLENDEPKTELSQTKLNLQQLNSIEAITKLQTKFFENTTQLLKVHINRAIGQGKGEDEVWLVDLDKMKNYKDYFPENNSCNLINKFNLQQRLKKLFEKSVCQIITNTCTEGFINGSSSNINSGISTFGKSIMLNL